MGISPRRSFFRLLSRICGSIRVLGAFLACETGPFPWLCRCGSRTIVWLPLVSCCCAPRRRRLKSLLGAEPVHQQFLTGSQHAGDLLDWFQAAAHGSLAPGMQEGGSPDWRGVLPEVLEDLFQFPCPGRRQLAGQQGVEFLAGMSPHPASLAQQGPAHIL